MGDLAKDFYNLGRNDLFFAAAQQAQFGCGLYPLEEMMAYTFAPAFGERGELRTRIAYLAENCDDTLRNVSGHAAKYWEEHINFGAYKDDYGIDRAEISRELFRYIDMHLGDQLSGTLLYPNEEVQQLRFLYGQ
mgnify:CR=1 FL=1